jgi:acetylornithine deacetylase
VSGAAAELLADLVRTPSPSGHEAAAAGLLAGWAAARGLQAAVDDAAVRLELSGPAAGPTLLFASHLDTVPPGEGWSVDPFAGVVTAGRLTGRGAVDAKASVAAMAAAAAALADGGGPASGRLIVLATYAEETRDTTMPRALERLGGEPAAAVVGEPTSLAPCVAQRGQLLLKLSWRGEQLHAGWAAQRRPPPANAIRLAARDLAALDGLRFERRHPLLGEVVVTPTLLEAGVARNVTPPRCEAVLDIRTTPCYGHAEITAAVAAWVAAEVEVLSDRLLPAATPEGSALLAAFVRVRPEAEPVASPTCSDWTFLRHLDALKLGPGDSRRSHTADEWVELAEVEEAARLYLDLAREVLG